MGWVTVTTGDPRIGILSIVVLFFGGMMIFRKVEEPDPDQPA
jgi:MFS-type transporter involved in bile tolerance (Atg22 family)